MRATSPTLLPGWLAACRDALETNTLGHPVCFLARTDSTNKQAALWVRAGAPDGALVIADDQQAGRGRAGRVWTVEPGANLTFSAIVRPPLPLALWPLVGFAAALAVARTVEACAPALTALVKWPNDVLVDGRKIAGLLLETARAERGDGALVVGIGLNVNQTDFPGLDAARVTSLALAAGREFDRGEVLRTLLETLETMLDLCGAEGRALLFNLYTARLANLGEEVTFFETATSQPVQGRLAGLTDAGALRIDTAEGPRTFHAGDLTSHQP